MGFAGIPARLPGTYLPYDLPNSPAVYHLSGEKCQCNGIIWWIYQIIIFHGFNKTAGQGLMVKNCRFCLQGLSRVNDVHILCNLQITTYSAPKKLATTNAKKKKIHLVSSLIPVSLVGCSRCALS